MQITLEPTSTVDTIDGRVKARIWEGETESGVPVKVWVAMISPQTHDAALLGEFETELERIQATRELKSFDVRLLD